MNTPHPVSISLASDIELPLASSTLLSLQGACVFTVATEILQRQTQATLEMWMMNTSQIEKTFPAEGQRIT